ncbi:protein transport protein Sec16A isoform X2 [Cylas formicarius]|uniref:protein transport protein Sec16A isoform X2 n=1 Tax=Cylas formicarius TaxID=197179 RepID=UPI0029588B73|nr:protein transport protein Sec16A isoform X2 [Cylas formicarius]
MSWVHQRGPKATSTAANSPAQPYNPNQQHSLVNNQWQPHDAQNWFNASAQPQQTFGQPQNYWQQPYANQAGQHPAPDNQRTVGQYDQRYQQPLSHQQNITQYEPQVYDHRFAQNNSGGGGGDHANLQHGNDWNWEWGATADENNSNVSSSTTRLGNLGDSFANDDSWNWPAQDNAPPPATKPDNKPPGKFDTPQWSVESQPSQESSDDVIPATPLKHLEVENKEIVFAHVGNDVVPADVGAEPVNLESVPDNAEEPDRLPQWHQPRQTENSEVPINDRNQYLETGQLRGGLQRMVPGQGDDSLPPFGRMVPGRTRPPAYDAGGPPEGLRRMVPGESSSPETTSRRVREDDDDDDDSEPELRQLNDAVQPRSATIGADTPPNASVIRSGAVGGGSVLVPTPVEIADPDARPPDQQRREFIEGQTYDGLSDVTDAVRDLSVTGDNPASHGGGGGSSADHRTRSRQDSSGDDSGGGDNKPPSRGARDKRGERRDRYSPDSYKGRRRDKRHPKEHQQRYDDDTDYYSDKEADGGGGRRTRDRDYDRKYNSLRRGGDKEKRRRDYREPRRGEYPPHYPRYRDAYDDQSRPSSRSDSMHESYRERKYRDGGRYRSRDAYNPYQSFAYDPYNPYYQQYQYYENLRRTNPQAYAEWYRKYYQQASSSYAGDDRASVHSGRSSANEEQPKDNRYARQGFYSQQAGYHGRGLGIADRYGLDQSSAVAGNASVYDAQRLTPARYATAHVKASISSGKLIRVLPNYPPDGQDAVVELVDLPRLLDDDERYIELSSFPGPLVKGVTHKKTLIAYCDDKISRARRARIRTLDSYVLMWELLKLLIRQNGMVIGTDIAELLLKNCPLEAAAAPPRPPSVASNASQMSSEGAGVVAPPDDQQAPPREDEATRKFREYLLYGSCKEALEWAMKRGLWGHALFLASKLDKRTYAGVMTRFANGLAINDPLQTLYQLLSGKVPAAVTCVADEKWGNWRPHLAMILSNSSQRPELNCKAITSLGDTLLNGGDIYAAQFCYLMAEVGFGGHGAPDVRLVLLGSDHRAPYPQFATNEAIHMTEIYEYACSLNDRRFVIGEFQIYKYLLATRLADFGLPEKSLAYLEKLAEYIVGSPGEVSPTFVDHVCVLADRLKFYDPVGDVEDESQFGSLLETSRPDRSWLDALKTVQRDVKAGVIQTDVEPPPQATYEADYATWQYQQEPPALADQATTPSVEYPPGQYQERQAQYWTGQQQQQQFQQWQPEAAPANFESEVANNNQSQTSYDINSQSKGRPQISMPNHRSAVFGDEPPREALERNAQPPPATKKSPVKDAKQGTGWFGGIFSKLSMKPKNQMILPDDKNPKIVWDEAKKRWTNVDEDGNEATSEFKPPPKMADVNPLPMQRYADPAPNYQPATENAGAPPKANMFKLQRGRNLKNSYVDVFNGAKTGTTGGAPPPPGEKVAAPLQMNFFVPPTVHDLTAPVDFLTPAAGPLGNLGDQARDT